MTKPRTFSIHCFDRPNGNYFHMSCIYLRAPSIRPLWVVRSYVVRRFLSWFRYMCIGDGYFVIAGGGVLPSAI